MRIYIFRRIMEKCWCQRYLVKIVFPFLVLVFLHGIASSPRAAEIKNVTAKQEGSRAVFTYDLVGIQRDARIDISITVEEQLYKASDLHLEGDFGKVATGPGRRIYWNVLTDFPGGFVGDVVWEITAASNGLTMPRETRAFMVTPKAGYSAFSGIFGVEVQFYRMAVAIGIVDRRSVTGGAKLYLSEKMNAFFIGACVYYRHDGSSKHKEVRTKEHLVGGVVGYRWLFDSGLNITVGGGLGDKTHSDRSTVSTEFITDLAIGYTF